jgi:cytosine permease
MQQRPVENVYKRIGKVSGFILSIILVIAFISWYMIDLQTATVALSNFFLHNPEDKNVMIRIGAVLGLLIALVSTGGISLIKHTCVVIFPFLLFFVIYTLSTGNWSLLLKSNWEFSFSATISVIALTLPGTVNLPTFFRHSRSIADSILALTLITIIYILFQSLSIFTELASPSEFLTKNVPGISSQIHLFLGLIFVIGSLLSLNLVNIYYASAAWELLVPHKRSPKEYAIIGLLGTAAYIFFQVDFFMRFLVNMASNLIASIGITLLAVHLIDITFRALIAGCSASLLAFLTIIVCEETSWSIRKLFVKKISTIHQR